MYLKTKGLVLRVSDYNDFDSLLTGIIRYGVFGFINDCIRNGCALTGTIYKAYARVVLRG